jgi:hypothetical protein
MRGKKTPVETMELADALRYLNLARARLEAAGEPMLAIRVGRLTLDVELSK